MRLAAACIASVAATLVTRAAAAAPACPNGTVPFPSDDCSGGDNNVAALAPLAHAGHANGDLCCQLFDSAFLDSLKFLKDNMPAFDAPNAATLFDNGIVGITPNVSLAAKAKCVDAPVTSGAGSFRSLLLHGCGACAHARAVAVSKVRECLHPCKLRENASLARARG